VASAGEAVTATADWTEEKAVAEALVAGLAVTVVTVVAVAALAG